MSHQRLRAWLTRLLLPPAIPILAMADTGLAARTPSDDCLVAISSAARQTGVPETILRAVSLTETGRRDESGTLRPWPWAINDAGESLWFSGKDEAVAFLQSALAEGRRNLDIGCFQLNWHWHGGGFASVRAMIDPRQNALYAAHFLQDLYYRTGGDWEKAVAGYHSQTTEFAEEYLKKFLPILAELGKSTALPPEPSERVNSFPLLKAGGILAPASLVPLTARARPLIGGGE